MNGTLPAPLPAALGHESAPDRAPARRFELLLIVGFWTFIALLTLANAWLDPRGRGLQPVAPASPIALAFAEAYLWALLTPFIFALSSRFSIDRSSWPGRLLLLFAVGMVVAIVVDVLVGLLRFQLFYIPQRAELGALRRVTRLWFMNEFIVYTGVVAAGMARHYFLRYRARREETMRLQAQAAQLQAQLADARLAALRHQLDPHFLFNTLHAVSALVERDPRGVRRMIARLSELLRTTLEGADEQEVPLEQELALLARYLEIMQIRFQGRLTVDEQVEPATRDALVPNLLLQPLVENAIKHGVSKSGGSGRIEIRAHREGERLVLSVRDDGPEPVAEAGPEREGVGLRNTRARLAQLYGAHQSLLVRPADGGGVIAQVALPYHTRADLRATAVSVET